MNFQLISFAQTTKTSIVKVMKEQTDLKTGAQRTSTYINLGEWVNYNSYGVLENGLFELKFHQSNYTKAINK